MLIGDLAKMAGVSIDTIRYYEREGLIRPASIRDSGYREFNDRTAERLSFIMRHYSTFHSLAEKSVRFSHTPRKNRQPETKTPSKFFSTSQKTGLFSVYINTDGIYTAGICYD